MAFTGINEAARTIAGAAKAEPRPMRNERRASITRGF
jgi:hypothetical protein